ncbi:Flp family type IVb pilin [Ornithinimicrobium avium]|nr:Flp family type IVb pilin [Ornithinimicrobium avium]
MGFKTTLRRCLDDERGATAVEYALLVALIASVIIGVVTTLGLGIIPGFQAVIDGLP